MHFTQLEPPLEPSGLHTHGSYGSAQCQRVFAPTLKFGPTKDITMKKTRKLTVALASSFAALAPLAALASPAPNTDSSQPTLVIKDSSITSSIEAKLASDPFKGLSHIDVDTDDHGVVTLKGKVPSQDAADRAIAIARATAGVREVKSALKIRIDD